MLASAVTSRLRRFACFTLLVLGVAACGGRFPANSLVPTGPLYGVGTDPLSGLPDSEAVHAGVEARAPDAFVVSMDGPAFLAVLQRVTRQPLHQLAAKLRADEATRGALEAWDSLGMDQRATALKRVCTLAGAAMGCRVPRLSIQAGPAGGSTTQAVFDPTGDSRIVLYTGTLASASGSQVMAAVLHEVRHAAQYQLVQADRAGTLDDDDDRHALAGYYAASWRTLDGLTSESLLAYGDYAHLDIEYDAFQAGNEVMALVAGKAYDADGNGFLDVRYDLHDRPGFDLLARLQALGPTAAAAALNLAEARSQTSPASPRLLAVDVLTTR